MTAPAHGQLVQGVLQGDHEHKVHMPAIQAVPNAEGTLPAGGSFFTITPANKLMLSALKQADDGNGMILRLWNTSSDKVKAEIETLLPVQSASLLKLDESPISDLPVKCGKIQVECGPHKIITLKLTAR